MKKITLHRGDADMMTALLNDVPAGALSVRQLLMVQGLVGKVAEEKNEIFLGVEEHDFLSQRLAALPVMGLRHRVDHAVDAEPPAPVEQKEPAAVEAEPSQSIGDFPLDVSGNDR